MSPIDARASIAAPDHSGDRLSEMSPAETRQLFRDSGFEIVRQYGFGVLPPSLYRTPVRGLAFAIDHAFAGDRAWNNWAVDMLFVCRPV